jgi:hypothetical protein
MCSGQIGLASALTWLPRYRKQKGLGPCGTFDAFLATAAGRRQRREGLAYIEAEAQRLAPEEPSASC